MDRVGFYQGADIRTLTRYDIAGRRPRHFIIRPNRVDDVHIATRTGVVFCVVGGFSDTVDLFFDCGCEIL